MVVGIGLTGALGFDWSAVHLVITFLVLGIGVDDMFILLQSWNNIEDNPEHKNKSITEKSGLVLKVIRLNCLFSIRNGHYVLYRILNISYSIK